MLTIKFYSIFKKRQLRLRLFFGFILKIGIIDKLCILCILHNLT